MLRVNNQCAHTLKSKIIPFSAACERNKDVILEVIRPALLEVKSVLEIGSGTGQHAVYFAGHLRHLSWQTSDKRAYLDGVRAQLETAANRGALMPIELDVNQQPWVQDSRRFDAVFTANTLHIMSWSDMQAFFHGLDQVTSELGCLIIYGPFKYQGKFTSQSNQEFDASLRYRGEGSAIRDFEAVNELARHAGFKLISDTPMPANNQCLVYRKGQQSSVS